MPDRLTSNSTGQPDATMGRNRQAWADVTLTRTKHPSLSSAFKRRCRLRAGGNARAVTSAEAPPPISPPVLPCFAPLRVASSARLGEGACPPLPAPASATARVLSNAARCPSGAIPGALPSWLITVWLADYLVSRAHGDGVRLSASHRSGPRERTRASKQCCTHTPSTTANTSQSHITYRYL